MAHMWYYDLHTNIFLRCSTFSLLEQVHTSSNTSRNTAGCPGQESYSLVCSVLYLHGGYLHPEALPSTVWILVIQRLGSRSGWSFYKSLICSFEEHVYRARSKRLLVHFFFFSVIYLLVGKHRAKGQSTFSVWKMFCTWLLDRGLLSSPVRCTQKTPIEFSGSLSQPV